MQCYFLMSRSKSRLCRNLIDSSGQLRILRGGGVGLELEDERRRGYVHVRVDADD